MSRGRWHLLETVRSADWWLYKIPPLLVSAYAGFLLFPSALPDWSIVARTLVAILLIAIFGYVQNDVCDVDADRQAGRPNRMSAARPTSRAVWIFAPAAAALSIAMTTGDHVLVAITATNLLVPTLYSVPPVRLKGRGLAGALADAAGVHLLPMAAMCRAVTLSAPNDIQSILFVTTALGWATAAGLRGILLHQVRDRDDDAAAGVVTWGGGLGATRARAIVLRLLLPIELLSLGLFVMPLLRVGPMLGIALVLYAAAESVKMRRGWTLPLVEHADGSREPYVPVINNELYEVWLPVALAGQLAIRDPWLWTLVLAHIYLFLPNLKVRLAITLKVLEPSA